MKIESIIKRRNGHIVEIDGESYSFLPPDYVAEVKNSDHVSRFLSIPEGYRPHGIAAKGAEHKPVAAPVQPAPVDYLLSEVHPAEFDVNDKTYSQADIVKLAAGDLTAEQWNAMDEGDRADRIDEQLDNLAADTNGDGEVDESEERAALAEKYEAKFGKKPHGKWKADRIREELDKE